LLNSISDCDNPDFNRYRSIFQGVAMAVGLAFLISLLCMIYPDSVAAVQLCISCHSSHYSAIGNCISCHRGDDRTLRKNIAHLNLVPGNYLRYRISGDTSVEIGKNWLNDSGCRRCHTFNKKGNRLAANLDHLSGRHPVSILESIIKPAAFMPDFRFDSNSANMIVNLLLSSSDSARKNFDNAPLPVRFKQKTEIKVNVFDKHCGGCHRILTENFGGLGRGVAGPNLSGLFTGYYSKTYGEGECWTPERLEKWFVNPRQSRPLARMQPINLSKSEMSELLLIMNQAESSRFNY
jgi:cytochrome c2